MEKVKDLKDLNDILFETLESLTKLNTKDENFENEKGKVEKIVDVAAMIIKNSELELRNQVWQATRRFSLTTRQTRQNALKIGCQEDADL